MKTEFEKLRRQLEEMFDFWGSNINDDDTCEFKHFLNDTLKRTCNFKLYRYTPATMHALRNLEKQAIFLSQNGTFNDIYEGLPSDDLSNISNAELSLLADSAYITCFSEKCDNLLMWSHYSDSHRGFCVEYDLNLLPTDHEVLNHIYPILYKNRRQNAPIRDIIDAMNQLNESIYQNAECNVHLDKALTLFTIKGLDWAYEREWRVIYTKRDMFDKSDENYIPKSLQMLSFPCISAVYLGYRIEDDVKNNIFEIVERLNNVIDRKIKVYKPFLANENYKIKFKEID